jgi:hypothetical protein
MAKIPIGDFGQVRAQVAPTQTPSAREVDGGLSDALQGLGNTGLNIAGAQLAKDRKAEADIVATADANNARAAYEQEQALKREAEKQAARAEQIKHLTATADIQNGLADSLDEINARVISGATKKDEARKEFAAASEKVVANSLANLPPDLAPLVEAQMRGLRGQLTNKLEDGIRKRDNQEADAGLIKYGEQMQRLAQTDPALAIKQHSGAVQALGPAAGWTPEQIAKTDQAFKEKVLYANSLAVVHAARGNIKALDQAGQVINQRSDMDPKTKEGLLNQVALQKESIVAANQRAQAAGIAAEELRLKKAGIAMESANKLADHGVLDDKTMEALISATSGTVYAPQVKQLFETQRITGALTGQPVAAVKSLLEQLHADVAVNKINPEKAKRIEQVTKVLRGQEADIKSMGALEAAQKHNASGVGVIEPINMGSVETITAGVAKRADQVAYADKWSNANSSFFKTDEAAAIGKTLSALAPFAQSAFIGTLAKTIPPKKMVALAEQIGESNKALSLSMKVGADQTTENRFTSVLILKGQRAITDANIKSKPDVIAEERKRMANYLGEAVDGELRKDTLDAALLVFHGMQAEGGSGDSERAVRLALGANIIERNKSKLVVPAGMDETSFEKAMLEAVKKSVKDSVVVRGQVVPREALIKSLHDAEIKMVGKGRYGVVVNNAIVTTDGKNRLMLEVGNVAP